MMVLSRNNDPTLAASALAAFGLAGNFDGADPMSGKRMVFDTPVLEAKGPGVAALKPGGPDPDLAL